MKGLSKVLGAAFLVGGLALIAAVFFLFLKECQPENLFYLNLAACCLMYVVSFVTMYDIVGSVDDVAKAAAGFGLRWIADGTYIFSVILLVVLSIVCQLNFNLCLIIHIALLLVYLWSVFVASRMGNLVSGFEKKEEQRKSGLELIKSRLDEVELSCRLSSGGSYMPKIENIREELRYISPSDGAAAQTIEAKIVEALALVSVKLSSNGVAEEIEAGLDQVLVLIDMRKKQY